MRCLASSTFLSFSFWRCSSSARFLSCSEAHMCQYGYSAKLTTALNGARNLLSR